MIKKIQSESFELIYNLVTMDSGDGCGIILSLYDDYRNVALAFENFYHLKRNKTPHTQQSQKYTLISESPTDQEGWLFTSDLNFFIEVIKNDPTMYGIKM